MVAQKFYYMDVLQYYVACIQMHVSLKNVYYSGTTTAHPKVTVDILFLMDNIHLSAKKSNDKVNKPSSNIVAFDLISVRFVLLLKIHNL